MEPTMVLPLLILLVLVFTKLSFWDHQLLVQSVEAIESPLASSPYSSPPIALPSPASIASLSPGKELEPLSGEGHKNMKLDSRLALSLFVTCGVLTIIVVVSLSFCFICYWRSSRRKTSDQCPENLRKGVSLTSFLDKFSSMVMVVGRRSVPLIDYNTIEKGTDNFGDCNLLGKGGFGVVYKASLDDNMPVAVKKLNCASEDAQREFENEVDLLSKIQHPNVICMLAYCVHQDMGFIVYELMPNGSLEDLLHGPSHGSSLNWHMRLKIALDTARGLEYLHEFCKPSVIHRDLKSSNILLDTNFNAKLSDFGLAINNNLQNQKKLKLSGTVGYVAPEYMLNGELTEKSDVYAYGVVLLELLLGRRPIEKLAPAHCQSIVTWAMPQLTNRSLLPNIVDPVIKHAVDEKYLFQVAAVAVLCVQPEPSYRPLITDVVHSLVPLVPFEMGGTLRVSHTPRASGSYQ